MSDIVTYDDHEIAPTSTLFGTDNPAEALAQMTKVATTLADVVRQQNLVKRIGQSDHVNVEGWTFLGSLLGVFPIVEWTRPVLDHDEKVVGWEARVVARTRAGEEVGSAEQQCLRSERTWAGRDDFALRGMAQTRAVSRALRQPLGFVMKLAGFNPTPAEEMPPLIEGNRPVREPEADAVRGGREPVSVAQPVLDGGEAASPTDTGTEGEGGSPSVDLNDPDIPFGDAPPDPPKPSAAQIKKLNVLVKAVGPESLAERFGPTLLNRVYATIADIRGWTSDELTKHVGGWDADGTLRWSPLRDSLSKHEAHELIDRLERIEAQA
jgi:hypothetical protein